MGDHYAPTSVNERNLNGANETASETPYEDFVRDKWMGDFDQHNLAIATLGLVGEAGEVAEKIKKQLRGDPAHNPTDIEGVLIRQTDVGKELGDVLFYLTWIAQYHGLTLEDVREMNVAKLEGRLERNGTLRGDGDNR